MININDFPDDILTHILSFLPYKDAFRTTILSKRWRPLPRSLAVLHIDDWGVNNTNDWFLFRQFMEAVIFSPNSQHLPLTSFYFISDFRDSLLYSSIFVQWVEAAKRRHVKSLSLYFGFGSMVPSTIFCCKTLMYLSLTRVSVAKIPGCSVDLPLLKYLRLSQVRFNDMENLIVLIYGCPKLEILRTSHVEVEVEAGDSVTVGGGYLKPLSKLIKAHISLFEVLPLRIFCDVQFLILSIHKFKMGKILQNEEINSYYLPVFRNLIDLRLCLRRGIHDWEEIVKILQNCPKLQTLLIEKAGLKMKEDWKYPYHIPKCVSSHLTSCKIIGYEAFEADFRFATYILQNARLLQVMTIRLTSRRKPFEIGSKYLKDLSSCQRISPACKLYVHYPRFRIIRRSSG